ncbi:hypothetical protein PPUJ21368_32750 [Pseudomonas putida]|nr:hypothetical protein PPUJ21368_32750 [Pseudomonas putida]
MTTQAPRSCLVHGPSGCGKTTNAVPPAAAEAVADVMGTTLLLVAQGETFVLSSMPIWVRPVAVGLSVAQREAA